MYSVRVQKVPMRMSPLLERQFHHSSWPVLLPNIYPVKRKVTKSDKDWMCQSRAFFLLPRFVIAWSRWLIQKSQEVTISLRGMACFLPAIPDPVPRGSHLAVHQRIPLQGRRIPPTSVTWRLLVACWRSMVVGGPPSKPKVPVASKVKRIASQGSDPFAHQDNFKKLNAFPAKLRKCSCRLPGSIGQIVDLRYFSCYWGMKSSNMYLRRVLIDQI